MGCASLSWGHHQKSRGLACHSCGTRPRHLWPPPPAACAAHSARSRVCRAQAAAAPAASVQPALRAPICTRCTCCRRSALPSSASAPLLTVALLQPCCVEPPRCPGAHRRAAPHAVPAVLPRRAPDPPCCACCPRCPRCARPARSSPSTSTAACASRCRPLTTSRSAATLAGRRARRVRARRAGGIAQLPLHPRWCRCSPRPAAACGQAAHRCRAAA